MTSVNVGRGWLYSMKKFLEEEVTVNCAKHCYIYNVVESKDFVVVWVVSVT